MCIYLGNAPDLHIKNQEHIFPSFLGGQKKLKHGVVSDEANSLLSKYEGELAHKSLLQLPRAFMGPGKRNTKRINKVIVYPLHDEQQDIWQLGYLFFGRVHLIPHIRVCDNKFSFTCDDSNEENVRVEANKFLQLLNTFLTARYKIIKLPIKDQDFFLLGCFNNNWYLCCGNMAIEDVYKKVQTISNSSNMPHTSKGNYSPQVYGEILENTKTEQIFAKIAFNVFAYLYGEDYVNHTNFDEVRNWIIKGNNNSEQPFTIPISTNEVNYIVGGLNFPAYSHWCILSIENDNICAIISLYSQIFRKINIGKKPTNAEFKTNGMLCDWKNKKEYTLKEWIAINNRLEEALIVKAGISDIDSNRLIDGDNVKAKLFEKFNIE